VNFTSSNRKVKLVPKVSHLSFLIIVLNALIIDPVEPESEILAKQTKKTLGDIKRILPKSLVSRRISTQDCPYMST
jgi:hypothetical protein